MSILCVKWLYTQQSCNPEVAIIFCAAARYRRAKVGSRHHDAHPVNSMRHTGAVRPHTGFVGSLFCISPRTGNGISQVFEMLPAFSCISWACAFRAGNDISIFLSKFEFMILNFVTYKVQCLLLQHKTFNFNIEVGGLRFFSNSVTLRTLVVFFRNRHPRRLELVFSRFIQGTTRIFKKYAQKIC
jgi:hypothetical protein